MSSTSEHLDPPAAAAGSSDGGRGRRAAPPAGGGRGWMVAAGVAVLALGAAGWWWLQGREGEGKKSAPSAAPTAKVQGDAIEFSAAALKAFGVRMAAVQSRELQPHLRLVGRADFDQAHYAAVGTRTKGLIREIRHYEGERVTKGEVLAVVDSTELAAAQAELSAASARVDAAAANAARERKLLQEKLTTAREAEQANAELSTAKAELAAAQQHVKAHLHDGAGGKAGEYRLTAPMEGVIVERIVSVGQTVEEHVLTFRIADLTRLWVELTATERQLQGIRVGDEVEIRPLAKIDLTLKGEVTWVGDVVDPVTGTAQVRVAMTCPERELRPGQSVTAALRAASARRTVTAVPREAVSWIDGKTAVFVAESPTRLRMVPIETGDDDGQWLEVRSGLKAGQQVVVEGLFAVKSELYR